MSTSPAIRAFIATPLLLVFGLLSCSDPAPPVPSLETLALSLDSIAIQFRDSASELTASPRGALGVELEAEVTWRSKNSEIVSIVPNGKSVRLVPVRPGVTEVEAIAEHLLAAAKVVVLDTVYSVVISAPDTIVTMGRSLQFTATVNGPPGASPQVVWTVGNSAVASIDSSLGKNPVLVVSLDTGATIVTATSASDRLKSSQARFRTAGPAELYFGSQPGETTAPVRANDILIPGPIVRVRDVLGNPYPGRLGITMTIANGTGTAGAALFGVPFVTYSEGEARFGNVGVDSSGSSFRLVASAAGLTATSATFDVGPECPGIPYTIGAEVSGTITPNSCQSNENVYYNRYVVFASGTSVITGKVAAPLRWGVVFKDGTRPGAQGDTTPHLIAGGRYSIRVYSGTNGQLGNYQLTTKFAFLTKQSETPIGWTCWRIQAHVSIEFSEELRCGIGSGTVHACGAGQNFTHGSPYRLHLHPNATATVSASSSAFDPCLEVVTPDGNRYVDDNSGGGTTARIVIPPSPVGRNVLVNVTGPQPIPTSSPFTMRITP